MTAKQFASFTNAKKVGKNRWITNCPSHPDKHPSLSITEGKRVPVLLKCQSQHCDPKDILKAFGLSWDALFDGKPTAEVRRRLSLSEQKESLERQVGLFCFGQVLEPEKRNYWRAAEVRARVDLLWVRSELEPEELMWELRKRAFRQIVRDEGWEDVLQREFLFTEAGMNFVMGHRRTPCTPHRKLPSTPSKRSTDATSPTKPFASSPKTTLDFGW